MASQMDAPDVGKMKSWVRREDISTHGKTDIFSRIRESHGLLHRWSNWNDLQWIKGQEGVWNRMHQLVPRTKSHLPKWSAKDNM